MTTATKGAHDWHCKDHDTYGWRGDHCRRCESEQASRRELAVLYMTGTWPEDQVDHKNGCRSDNQWDNLRSVTRSENCHNQSLSHLGSTSDFIGVHFDKRRGLWAAQIRLGRVSKWLGYHPTAEAAHAAYLKAKDELHPTHLRLREAA